MLGGRGGRRGGPEGKHPSEWKWRACWNRMGKRMDGWRESMREFRGFRKTAEHALFIRFKLVTLLPFAHHKIVYVCVNNPYHISATHILISLS